MKELNMVFLQPGDFKKAIEYLTNEYDDVVGELGEVTAELHAFRKDDEIARLEDEVRNLRRRSLHCMNETEYERYKAFRDTHYKKCKNAGHYRIDLYQTGIGACIAICCPICMEELDITDVSDW